MPAERVLPVVRARTTPGRSANTPLRSPSTAAVWSSVQRQGRKREQAATKQQIAALLAAIKKSSAAASTLTRGVPADYYDNPPVRGRAEQQASSLTTMTADGQFCEYCSRNHPGPMSMRCFGINPPAGNTKRIRHAEALQAKWRTRKHLQTERVTAWAVALAHHLGLPLHPSKSRLTPSEEIDFLGMHLRSCQTDVVIQLTPPRRASLLSQLRQLRRRLRNARSVTPRAKAAWRRRTCSQCRSLVRFFTTFSRCRRQL